MKRLNKKVLSRTFVIGMMVLVLNITCLARLNNNGSGRGYIIQGVAYNNIIEDYITSGANFYLSAAADIQNLIKLIEVQDNQGIDLAQLNKLTESALYYMQNAQESYKKLIEIAAITPYNESIQAALKKFDYNSFQVDNDLNGIIFENIEKFLSHGDITGALKKTYSYFTVISGLLYDIKGDVSAAKLTDIKTFWKLNEICAETSLFGSYTARVFFALQ